ncbi:hypothetical protein BG006_006107 [Podila minutissima]|uniref:RGS domain-containing protein n=1 Tax=Podila minutissima TaxID=64525 RepID=A0A9P5VLA2_9FUNG|nr:hypothetical protein BG006_006107 [Podila minutissima]
MGGPYGPVRGLGHRHAYLAAAVIMGSFCLITTITMFYLAGTHNDLKQRGRYLVFWNGLSATGIVTVYLMLNAYVGDFPCFILLWTSYLCIVPWLLTYLARGFRLVYIYNQQVDIGNRILQRSNLRGSHTNTSQQNLAVYPTGGAPESNTPNSNNQGASGISMDTGSNTVLGSSTVPNSRLSPDLNGAVTFPPSTTSYLALEGTNHNLTGRGQEHEYQQEQGAPTGSGSRPLSGPASNIPNFNAASSSQPQPPTRLGSRLFVPESRQLSAATMPSPNTLFPEIRGIVFEDSPHRPTSNRDPESQLMSFEAPVEDSHWNRYLPFNQVTDGRLTIFLMAVMVLVAILCLGMQFVKPSPVQIAPINYLCGDGPVFFPVYAFMFGFLAIGCPILTWKLWWIKDGFGIRNELLINMIIGLPGFILYFVSPFKLKRLDAGHWNHTNWLTLTIFFAHFNSVVLPLLRFFGRQIPQRMPDGKNKPMTSIFRWDSNKSIPETPNPNAESDTASFRFHSPSPSPSMPSTSGNMDMDGISMESPSLRISSGASQGISVIPDSSLGTAPIGRSRSRSRSGSKPPRYRGMKGFWAKYGTDSEGKMIPLSQINPKAFEYALNDQEMLAELVKFSITVFSAENTKFLQEYEGLKKQVQEYYRLVGAQTQRNHSRSAIVSSDNAMGGASGSGSQPSTTSPWKVPSILESVASSIRKFSTHGSSDECHSRCGSRSESMIEIDLQNVGEPGTTLKLSHTMTNPYFGQDTDSSAHYNKGDESAVRVQRSSPLSQQNSEFEDGSDRPGAPSKMTSTLSQMNSLSSFDSVNGSFDNPLQIASGSTSAPQAGRVLSTGSYPSLTQMRSQSPLHSPSSSVSATFTPRLPSQPSLTFQAIKTPALAVDKCTSPRSVLTAEEHLQNQGTTTTPLLYLGQAAMQISPARQQPQVSYCLSPDQHQLLPGSPLQQNIRPKPSHQSSQSRLISALMLDRKTAVPEALLPAYWEIANTFIMPNAVLELNLDEAQVEEIRGLFVHHACFLEMYEPVVRSVQELVYANVWPRFVQSLQKHPRGLPRRMRILRIFVYSCQSDAREQEGDEEDRSESVATNSVVVSERKAGHSSGFSLAGIRTRWRRYWGLQGTSQTRDGERSHAQSGIEMAHGRLDENAASGGW